MSASLVRELAAGLLERNAATQLYRDYYDGNFRLAFATSKVREAFG